MAPRRVAAAGLAAALAAGLAASPARAWDDQGHMATGAVAYDLLSRTAPGAVRTVVALMARHPDAARFARELGAAQGAARDRLLFEYMARWPDDVRRTRFSHEDWHYRVQVVSPAGAVLAFHNGRAREAFLAQLAVARDAGAPAADRATALCWVMHLMGDMHQPLHAGHWLDARFPLTDRAGTLAWIRPAPAAPTMRLHVFWDRAADRPGGETAGAEALAAALEARPPAAAAAVTLPPAVAFDGWAAESRALALHDAYLDGRLERGTSPEDAAPAPPGYDEHARDVADARLAEAAADIAALLATLPAGAPP